MLNVTFYENTITNSAAPKKTGECHLETLKNGSGMFYDCTALESFNSDLSSLTNGEDMFNGCSNLKSFDSDLSSLTNGSYMFRSCRKLTSFNSDLSSLTNGNYMFYLTALESFNSDLSSLTYGFKMFSYTYFESFNSDLSSLTNGTVMFQSSHLETFNSDLSSLTTGYAMFNYCQKLTSFNGDLSNMTYGFGMFGSCGKLTSFNGDLSSLTIGGDMFRGCKLDPQSVMIIANSIRDITTEKASLTSSDYVTRTGSGTDDDPYIYSKPFGWMSDGSYVYTRNNPKPYTTATPASYVGQLTIGINVTNDSSTIATQLQEFAEAAYYDSWNALKEEFTNKGWTVTWQYGGTSNSITLNELDGQTTSLPIWAKLEEVTEENGNYCTEDGSKYYNISWGHDVNEEAKDSTNTDTSKFFLFGSLLEAMGYFGVIPKEYVEKNSDSSEQNDENTSN